MLEKATTKAESASALDRRRHGPSQGAQGGAQVVADREKLEAEAAAQIQTISKAWREANGVVGDLREDLEEARDGKTLGAKQVDRLSSELQASHAKMRRRRRG